MNKQMIFSIIAAVIVLFLGFGFYKASKLTNIHITKKVTIDGTQEEVFNMVKYLGNYPKWSPFLEADPAQKYEVKGEDGQVGVQFHWEGNAGKDVGYQEIVKIDEAAFVGVRCDIQKPFVATPTFDYSFSSVDNEVTVSQDFRLESGIVDAFFMWLFGAESEMAAMNERGLTLLKNYVEK